MPASPAISEDAPAGLGLLQRLNVTAVGMETLELGAVAAAYMAVQYQRAGIGFTVTTTEFAELVEGGPNGVQGNKEFIEAMGVLEQLVMREQKAGAEAMMATLERKLARQDNDG